MEQSHKLEAFWGLTLVGLIALMLATGIFSGAYRDERQSLGREWYSRGQSDLKQGKTDKAIIDFRTALAYTRENDAAELSLAEALIAAKSYSEARGYLTSLWEREPGNAQVNLELARLAAIDSNKDEALRYYHNALYDDWDGQDPAQARRVVRLELYQFLMKQGDRRQAQAELVGMSALLPPDPRLYTQAGRLFLEVGDPARAAEEFQGALRFGAGEPAEEGLAEAEYLQGYYRESVGPLERALRNKPRDPRLTAMLDQATAILGIDPSDPALTPSQRANRVLRAFHQALARLSACGIETGASGKKSEEEHRASVGPLPPTVKATLDPLAERAASLQPRARTDELERDPNLQSQFLDLTFEIEQAAAEACGTATPLDRALILLGRRRAGSNQ